MLKAFLLASAAMLSATAADAVVVNLSADSTTPNAGQNSGSFTYNPVNLTLAAGTYTVGVVGIAGGGLYDAYSVYAPTPTNTAYTDGNWSVLANGVTQTQFSTTRYNTAAEALAAYSARAPLTFTLSQAGSVSFFLDDTAFPYFSDDAGGVSLAVNAAVPEPASWALMLTGFGAVGGAMRMRRRTAMRTA